MKLDVAKLDNEVLVSGDGERFIPVTREPETADIPRALELWTQAVKTTVDSDGRETISVTFGRRWLLLHEATICTIAA